MKVTEFDVIFISYDEPNADDNWNDLKNKCPWAKRSHGVYGSDAAHKAAAKLSDTSRFITIDADNIVDPDFFNLDLDMSKVSANDVMSWAAKNEINGLAYGNGGIKCWPKHVVETMKTHEIAPANAKSAQVDFCWDINYIQMNNIYSRTLNNASPLQAWRAGFREGCKMTLSGGDKVEKEQFQDNIHPLNYRCLLIWQSVGSDSLNVLWAIYGARLGAIMTNIDTDDWDWRSVRDFEWLNKFWRANIEPKFESYEISSIICDRTGYSYDEEKLTEEIIKLGNRLNIELDVKCTLLNKKDSKFFKDVYVNPARVDPLASESKVINYIDQEVK